MYTRRSKGKTDVNSIRTQTLATQAILIGLASHFLARRSKFWRKEQNTDEEIDKMDIHVKEKRKKKGNGLD